MVSAIACNFLIMRHQRTVKTRHFPVGLGGPCYVPCGMIIPYLSRLITSVTNWCCMLL